MFVPLHVLSAIDICLKRFVTVWTHVWPFIAMCHQMSLHAALRREFRIAYRTTVRPRIVVRM